MRIRKYTFKFILLGADKKVYLRYYVTANGKGLTLNIPINLIMTPVQVAMLNAGTLNDLTQKAAYQIKNKYVQIIEVLNLQNNSYPTPEQIREYLNITEKALELNYFIHNYYNVLKTKRSTNAIYTYALGKFKQYYEYNHINTPVKVLIQRSTIDNYERWLYADAKRKEKSISPITIHNCKNVIRKFLNYIAEQYQLPRIDFKIKIPAQSSKWHITAEDVDRLLKFKPTTIIQEDVLNIIRLNIHIGMRITDILNIQQENISFDNDCAYIRFYESKRKIERTVVVVNPDAINVLHKFNGWNIYHYSKFNYTLKKIAEDVFKEETIKIYRIDSNTDNYVVVLKSDAISSHAFRRYAIEQNLVNYGIDVARSLSGHTNYQTITRHYASFIRKEDLKKILIKK